MRLYVIIISVTNAKYQFIDLNKSSRKQVCIPMLGRFVGYVLIKMLGMSLSGELVWICTLIEYLGRYVCILMLYVIQDCHWKRNNIDAAIL